MSLLSLLSFCFVYVSVIDSVVVFVSVGVFMVVIVSVSVRFSVSVGVMVIIMFKVMRYGEMVFVRYGCCYGYVLWPLVRVTCYGYVICLSVIVVRYC